MKLNFIGLNIIMLFSLALQLEANDSIATHTACLNNCNNAYAQCVAQCNVKHPISMQNLNQPQSPNNICVQGCYANNFGECVKNCLPSGR